MAPIFACIAYKNGVVDEAALELVAAAERIDARQRPTAILTGWGADLDAACESVRGSFAEVWKIAHEALAYPDAEVVRQALASVLPENAVVLLLHDHFAVDLAPGLSIKTHAAYVPDAIDIERGDGTSLTVVRQEFGGQVNARLRCDIAHGAVITLRPGALPSPSSVPGVSDQSDRSGVRDRIGPVVDVSDRLAALTLKRRHIATIEAESGDVDITKHHILVSIGRGIQDRENIPIANELAEVLDGAVSCSRPVVDAKWLDKSRQVGSSGRTVRPKVYLACGISGSFQHLAGLKGNPFIVAVNKNPNAPIFRVADVGIVDDLLEFLPALTARVREARTVEQGMPA